MEQEYLNSIDFNVDCEKETKKEINIICYGCIIAPTCTKICDIYFDRIGKFLGGGLLFKNNWMNADKSICDNAASIIWRGRKRRKLKGKE